MVTLINPGLGPVAYDEQGRSIGGGEQRDVGELDSVAERAIEQGHLLRAEDATAKGDDQSTKTEDANRSAKTEDAKPTATARRGEKS